MPTRNSWRTVAVSFVLSTLMAATIASQSAETDSHTGREALPYWAFVVNPPPDVSAANSAPIDNTPQHVPGSVVAFTLAQIGDLSNAPGWHPDITPPCLTSWLMAGSRTY